MVQNPWRFHRCKSWTRLFFMPVVVQWCSCPAAQTVEVQYIGKLINVLVGQVVPVPL